MRKRRGGVTTAAEKTEEDGEEEGEQEKSFDADGEDYEKGGGLGQDGLSGKGKAKGQEEEEGVMAVPP